MILAYYIAELSTCTNIELTYMHYAHTHDQHLRRCDTVPLLAAAMIFDIFSGRMADLIYRGYGFKSLVCVTLLGTFPTANICIV